MPRSLTRISVTPAAAAIRSRISAPARMTSARRGSRPIIRSRSAWVAAPRRASSRPRVGARQPIAVHAGGIVARERERHRRQRRDRTGDADQRGRRRRERDVARAAASTAAAIAARSAAVGGSWRT